MKTVLTFDNKIILLDGIFNVLDPDKLMENRHFVTKDRIFLRFYISINKVKIIREKENLTIAKIPLGRLNKSWSNLEKQKLDIEMTKRLNMSNNEIATELYEKFERPFQGVLEKINVRRRRI